MLALNSTALISQKKSSAAKTGRQTLIGYFSWIQGIYDGPITTNGGQAGTMVMLILTIIGYIIYNAIPRAMTASGISIFFPESVGMVIG